MIKTLNAQTITRRTVLKVRKQDYFLLQKAKNILTHYKSKNMIFNLLFRKSIPFFVSIFGLLIIINSSTLTAQNQKIDKTSIEPAQLWLDNKGNHINAHGGGVLFHNGIYYWYGEHKIKGKSEANFADGGIQCYTSVDLINWTDAGIVLGVDYDNTNSNDLTYGCLIERPKVVFNTKTRKFLAYFKFYPKGNGYEVAYVGVATSESPAGPFNYSHKFLGPSPKGSGDFSMFVDDNGDLFHLAVRKPDKAFVIAKMRDDYMLPIEEYKEVQNIEHHTEAPAIVKIKGIYHFLGSGSTGWKPNVARYYTSTNLYGPWKQETNPCSGLNPIDNLGIEKTWGGQSSFILKVNGIENGYVALFDVWYPDMPIKGRYIWLPILLKDNKFTIDWINQWNLDVFKKE
jgi:hypothetical protein